MLSNFHTLSHETFTSMRKIPFMSPDSLYKRVKATWWLSHSSSITQLLQDHSVCLCACVQACVCARVFMCVHACVVFTCVHACVCICAYVLFFSLYHSPQFPIPNRVPCNLPSAKVFGKWNLITSEKLSSILNQKRKIENVCWMRANLRKCLQKERHFKHGLSHTHTFFFLWKCRGQFFMGTFLTNNTWKLRSPSLLPQAENAQTFRGLL